MIKHHRVSGLGLRVTLCERVNASFAVENVSPVKSLFVACCVHSRRILLWSSFACFFVGAISVKKLGKVPWLLALKHLNPKASKSSRVGSRACAGQQS